MIWRADEKQTPVEKLVLLLADELRERLAAAGGPGAPIAIKHVSDLMGDVRLTAAQGNRTSALPSVADLEGV